MKEYYITLDPLQIDWKVFFKGTEEEQQEAEAKEAERAAEIEKIIFSADFIAAEYINYFGQRRILHRSTRPGVEFQLSYIDPDGVPAMHENFINVGGNPEEVGAIHTKEQLLRHYVHEGNEDPLTLHILRREEKAA